MSTVLLVSMSIRPVSDIPDTSDGSKIQSMGISLLMFLVHTLVVICLLSQHVIVLSNTLLVQRLASTMSLAERFQCSTQ